VHSFIDRRPGPPTQRDARHACSPRQPLRSPSAAPPAHAQSLRGTSSCLRLRLVQFSRCPHGRPVSSPVLAQAHRGYGRRATAPPSAQNPQETLLHVQRVVHVLRERRPAAVLRVWPAAGPANAASAAGAAAGRVLALRALGRLWLHVDVDVSAAVARDLRQAEVSATPVRRTLSGQRRGPKGGLRVGNARTER